MITNYQTLQDTINIYLARQELSDRVQTFIQMFETEALLDNRIRETKVADLDIEQTNSLSLPADFKEVVSWSLDGFAHTLPMIASSPDLQVRTDDTAGTPTAFWIEAGYGTDAATDVATARFSPPPSSDMASTLVYRASITPLSTSSDTNWLLRRYPKIYLYGALAETAMYLRDDARLPAWMMMKEELVTRLHDFESRREFSGPTDVRYNLGGSEL